MINWPPMGSYGCHVTLAKTQQENKMKKKTPKTKQGSRPNCFSYRELQPTDADAVLEVATCRELILQVASKIWMILYYIFVGKPKDMYELKHCLCTYMYFLFFFLHVNVSVVCKQKRKREGILRWISRQTVRTLFAALRVDSHSCQAHTWRCTHRSSER